MGGFMFVLGSINRRESHLAYFGALSVGWALARRAPVAARRCRCDNAVAEFLLCSLLAFITWAAVQFLLRYAGCASPLGRLAAAAAVRADAAVAAGRRARTACTRWPASGTCCWRCRCWPRRRSTCARQRRTRSRSFWPMAALLAAAALAGAVEFAAQLDGMHAAGRAAGAARRAADAGAGGPAPGAAARPRAAAGRARHARSWSSACARPPPRSSATSASWPSCASSRSPSASASASPPTCTTTWAPSC